jgi:hypothetical protein
MAIVHFSSRPEMEAIEIHFLTVYGTETPLTLLVDSGFTGQSSFVLPHDAPELIQAAAVAGQASGALHGLQQRALVTCRIPQLAFERSFIAILADLTPLALPPGVHGLVGLRFLRHFKRWGAERTEHGSWRFSLSNDSE